MNDAVQSLKPWSGFAGSVLVVAVALGPVRLVDGNATDGLLSRARQHLPGLEFIATLMADVPPLPPNVGYYQRLVARDQSEAFDLIARYIKTEAPESVYDALLLPALNYAERDRLPFG